MKEDISLRLVTSQDLDQLIRIKTDQSLWLYETEIMTDTKDTRARLLRRMESSFRQYFIQKSDGTVVGELHIHPYVPERGSFEVGYAILPPFRGQGFAKKALEIALQWAFEEWHAHKVVAMTNAMNTPSLTLLKSFGFVLEGVFREELYWQGRYVDQHFYCLLDREYKHSK